MKENKKNITDVAGFSRNSVTLHNDSEPN